MSYKTIFGEEFENEFDEKMTHKYGDKYKCVKSVYPDVCKLPESEIQPMTYIARYQGDTVDEAKDLVRKYVKEKEPMWKQEYFQKPQDTNKPYLQFDGEKLSWIDNGKVIKSWAGMSGNPKYQCKTYQNMAGKGPLPEGRYAVKQKDLQHFDDLSFWDEFKSNIGVGPWPKGIKAWGNHRVWLKPLDGTKTYNRADFSIHGGKDLGSGGCIDLTNQIDDFNQMFKDYNGDLELQVQYPQECWYNNKQLVYDVKNI